MAKKKIMEDPTVQYEQTEAVSAAQTEGYNHTAYDEASDNSEVASSEEGAQTEENKASEALPKFVKEYLQRHPELAEVYIDAFGGVFASDTSAVFVQNAVLYQNPFYQQ